MMETSARVFKEISSGERDQLDQKKKKAKMNDNLQYTIVGDQRSNRLANHGDVQAYGCKKIS
jgi:hypothetical protein